MQKIWDKKYNHSLSDLGDNNNRDFALALTW